MKDIILVTTYLRPEYLQLCLEHLANTERTDMSKEFWICADNRPDDELRWKLPLQWQADVLESWQGKLPIKFIKGPVHNYNGNSYNTLESYKKAYEEPDVRNVYLVEDDVLVTPDFFKWHEAVAAAEPKAFCSIAYRCSRNKGVQREIIDPSAYFTTKRDFASIGVRWPRERMDVFLRHARPEYYSNMKEYIKRYLMATALGDSFTEQDGLIERTMLYTHAFTTWPYVPRCYHMGWYGYHRPNGRRPDGYLDAKVKALREIIRDPQKVAAAAVDFGDIEPYPTSAPGEIETLRRQQEFQ